MGTSSKTIALFFRSMSAFLEAGMNMEQALGVAAKENSSRRFAKIIEAVRGDLLRGGKFSSALEKQGAVFSPFFVEYLRAAEESGRMAEAVLELAKILEREARAWTKVRHAFAYPLFLFFASIFLLPLHLLVAGLTREYLAQTVGLLVKVAGLCTVLVVMHRVLARDVRYGILCDAMRNAIPLLGGIFRRAAYARFLRTFAALFSAGVKPYRAVEVAGAACGNRAVTRKISGALPHLAASTSFTEAFSKAQALPSVVLQMISVGEKSGEMEKSASVAARYLEEEAEARVQLATKLLPPLILLIVGAYIGYQVISFWRQYYSGLLF